MLQIVGKTLVFLPPPLPPSTFRHFLISQPLIITGICIVFAQPECKAIFFFLFECTNTDVYRCCERWAESILLQLMWWMHIGSHSAALGRLTYFCVCTCVDKSHSSPGSPNSHWHLLHILHCKCPLMFFFFFFFGCLNSIARFFFLLLHSLPCSFVYFFSQVSAPCERRHTAATENILPPLP